MYVTNYGSNSNDLKLKTENPHTSSPVKISPTKKDAVAHPQVPDTHFAAQITGCKQILVVRMESESPSNTSSIMVIYSLDTTHSKVKTELTVVKQWPLELHTHRHHYHAKHNESTYLYMYIIT